jgi:hypothetical protein
MRIKVWYLKPNGIYHLDEGIVDTYRFKFGIGKVICVIIFDENTDVWIKWIDCGSEFQLGWIWLGTNRFDFRKYSFRNSLSNIVKVTEEIVNEISPVILYKLIKGKNNRLNPKEHTKFRKVLLESCRKILETKEELVPLGQNS